MKFFRNCFTYRDDHFEAPTTYEHPKGVSMTIPDQTLSLRELVARHTRGQSVPQHIGVFDDDNDNLMPELDKMDTLQKVDYLQSLKQSIQQTQQDLAKPKPTPIVIQDDEETPDE